MPEHEDVLNDVTRLSCRQVLYSCQYEQLLYRRRHVPQRHVIVPRERMTHSHVTSERQHVLERQVALPESQCEQTCGTMESSNGCCVCNNVVTELGQCNHRNHEVNRETEGNQENKTRKLHHKRYRMTSCYGDCHFRHNPRMSFLTSDNNRRRRFPTIAQRKAANMREQRRMYNLKEAFKSVRDCLPTFSYEKKMSRIETLKLTIAYISFLRKLLEDCEQDPLKQISKNQSETETGREC